MAIYLHICTIIINKQAIHDKYAGGLAQFKVDFHFTASDMHQEDKRLVSFGMWDQDQFDIQALVEAGLEYHESDPQTSDILVIYRYNDAGDNGWLHHNQVFAWHIDAGEKELHLVETISNMAVDDINVLRDMGHNLLQAIWVDE